MMYNNSKRIFILTIVLCPIIFTTAYDQFWMNAFESNGIAYLLKPFSRERFQNAWDKFLLLRNSSSDENKLLTNLAKLIEQNFKNTSYKTRFTIPRQHAFIFVDIEMIAFFAGGEGVVFAFDTTGKKHLLNELTLKEIEEQLNPSHFFRINRSELVSKQHIERIERCTKNTLHVKIKSYSHHLKTSQSNTAAFRAWLQK